MANKFQYTGNVCHTIVSIIGYNFNLHIEALNDGKFEAYTEGGSYGIFKTYAKALTFAEKSLVSTKKNNPDR